MIVVVIVIIETLSIPEIISATFKNIGNCASSFSSIESIQLDDLNLPIPFDYLSLKSDAESCSEEISKLEEISKYFISDKINYLLRRYEPFGIEINKLIE